MTVHHHQSCLDNEVTANLVVYSLELGCLVELVEIVLTIRALEDCVGRPPDFRNGLLMSWASLGRREVESIFDLARGDVKSIPNPHVTSSSEVVHLLFVAEAELGG